MSIKRTIKATFALVLLLGTITPLLGLTVSQKSVSEQHPIEPLKTAWAANTVAKHLGWVKSATNHCDGYYLEAPFTYSENSIKDKLIEITSDGPVLFAQHGTSEMQGHVTATQTGQQITADKAYLYRDPATSKLVAMDLFGDVHLRQPGTLVVAKKAHLDLVHKSQALDYILYRTTIYSNRTNKPAPPSNQELQQAREVTQLSAWGKAKEFIRNMPKVFELKKASYTTCAPNTNTWKVKANDLVLDKNTGRGVATHARLYIQGIPVFYTPYLNFPIDDRRQTGFLWPAFGTSNKSGPYLATPFYWNIAPNYDTTITPVYMDKRGLQLNDLFRYLTPKSDGKVNLSFSPNDKTFGGFQTQMQSQYNQPNSTPVQLADLKLLQKAGSTRGAMSWKHDTRFNANWSDSIDYNIVSDDYYLRDYRYTLNETTQNQLLQQAQVDYKQRHWNAFGRIQQYQTLHPVDDITPTLEQYSRFPQLVLEGDYPDQKFGLDYFVANDLTHFDIRNTPGIFAKQPMGTRLNVQPGVALPFNLPYFYVTPRIQMAMTNYEIGHIQNNSMRNIKRSIPIFDVASGLYFDRTVTLFGHDLQQTLEPQIYYTYIPYHNQTQIPNFDTTLNTLTYDQLFTYNRFSGLDRIGDANQVSLGVTTHFYDANTGNEKIRLGVGEIIYFSNRLVTLCTADNPNCLDPTSARNNTLRRSPISGVFTYNLHEGWSLTGNTIWNTQINEVDNQSMTLSYRPDAKRVLNLGYNFVRNGDLILPTAPPNSSINNLKQANLSFAWPVFQNWSAIGRITKSINRNYFQNLIYGLQYDSCCWAVRFVAGRTFTNLDPLKNNMPQYDKQFYVQFALRGLGNIGTGDPSQFISSNTGYAAEFGQDY